MNFRTVLLVSATLMGFVTFAEAGCAKSKNTEHELNEKGRMAVEFANSKDNPLRELRDAPWTFDCNGETMTIECIKGPSLSSDHDLFEWAGSLLEKNMKAAYEESPWNWNLESKMGQMTADPAYLLIVRSSSGQPVGFSHFRFEMEWNCDEEVVYCIELQVEESMRGRGIGTHLLNTVTDIANHFNMRKTMVTVFTKNSRARKLYERLEFSADATSPTDTFVLVLSKFNPFFTENI